MLSAERHSRKLFFQPLSLLWFGRLRQFSSQSEEALFLRLFRFKPGLDQVHQNPVCARLLLFRQGPNAPGDTQRDGHTLTD